MGIEIDGANQKLILDSDGDTYIEGATDDTLKVYVSGAEDLRIAANAINVLSGTTLTIDSGATITNSGTANGFGSNEPSSADGQALGSASAEWSDLFLADGGIVYFGNDQDIRLTHNADKGLIIKHSATADDKPVILTLQTGETDMAADDVIGKIEFQAPDEGTGTDAVLVSGAIQAVAEGNHSSSSNATRLEFMTGASEAAATKMWLTSGGKLGLGTAPDLGTLHVRTADSSGGVSADADELVLENSGHAGVTIASGNSSNGNIYFSDSGNSAIGYIQYGHDNNDLTIVTNDTGGTLIDSGGRLATGGEAAPDADPGGITVDTNTSDSNNSEFMTFKNAATNHGFTDFGEADTNGRIETQSDNGGLMFSGLTENDTPFLFKGYVNASNTYKSAQGQGAFAIYLGYTDGSTGVTTTYGANSNLFSIRRAMSGNNTVFLVDEDGDVLYDGSTSAYDEYDDAHLIRAYDQYKAPDAIIQNKFDKFVKYNRQSLIDAKLIGDCPIEEERAGTNKPLVSLTGFQRLHNGAIWQQYTKHQQLLEAVYDLAKEAVGEDKADAILEKHEIKRLQ